MANITAINYNYDGTGYNYLTDLPLIKAAGITKVRLLIEAWNYPAGITLWKTIAQYALTLGFTEVVFGLAFENYTQGNQAAHTAAMLDFANWMAAQTVPVGTTFVLCIGNEVSFHITDGSTSAQVRAYFRTLYAAVKAAHPTMVVTYSMANGEMFPFFQDFTNSALPYPWDYASVNLYTYPTGQTSGTDFNVNLSSAVAWFGSTVVVSEFGPDSNGYSDSVWKERSFYTEQFLQNFNRIIDHNIHDAYAYNFQGADFGCLSPNRIWRPHWYALTGQRRPLGIQTA